MQQKALVQWAGPLTCLNSALCLRKDRVDFESISQIRDNFFHDCKYTPLYKKDIKETQNKPMETIQMNAGTMLPDWNIDMEQFGSVYMDILITRLDVCHVFELKGNINDSTVWNTGETGDITAIKGPSI